VKQKIDYDLMKHLKDSAAKNDISMKNLDKTAARQFVCLALNDYIVLEDLMV
jgi:hypothetical protein